MDKLTKIAFLSILFLAIDLYAYYAIRPLFDGASLLAKRILFSLYWGITAFSILAVVAYNVAIPDHLPKYFRSFIIVSLGTIYFSKTFGLIFILIDDMRRGIVWVFNQAFSIFSEEKKVDPVERLDFMRKASIAAAAIPLSTLTFGVISGAYDYRIRRKTITLPNLPSSFDGIRIAQLSDIHSGSFYNKTAVQGGVDMLLNEKPDAIFFTGDLVNTESDELDEYFDVFKQVKAPLGVFSTLGNHDYGDYRYWSSEQAKRKNLEKLIQGHKEMGWDILLNENRKLTVDQESIGVIGVENWGAGRFSKYGDLGKAYSGTEDLPVKLLLSHDPSHWDAEIRPKYSDIDMTFAGHTHGFQFGIEIGNFRWSPSQYLYKQWADLYQENQQYLYVNRGFGFLGYPGRVGILPEITIFEFKRA